MTQRTVTLIDKVNNKEVELPVVEPVLGTPGIDISTLPKAAGYFTHDPGYGVTSSCVSKITYIDGAAGKLMYRGYPIETLCSNNLSFLDVTYLLYHGELPTPAQSKEFDDNIRFYRMLNRRVQHFFEGFNYDAHPMAILTGIVGSLAAFYHDRLDVNNPEDRYIASMRLIAKIPTIAACTFRYSRGYPFGYPKEEDDYFEHFLRTMFERPGSSYEIDPLAAKALNLLFILHADHEQNASTSTVRLAGSTGTNPYAAVSAGIAALWGAAHGGANEAVLKMLDQIGTVENIPKFIAKAKDKNDPFKLMGFGHRVYRNYDPRARIIQNVCYDVLKHYGDDPRMELALRLEEAALKDDYFIERKLYPNVDFYSGIIYSALKIPVNMFTAMFAVARTAGWVSHWNEMISEGYRIGRPRQMYMGSEERTI
ncbi:MAG: citrate synthase [Cardiobacteriaceae bacterium]|nr:citrate synthase [Cardiobacteriaceae bacterium]